MSYRRDSKTIMKDIIDSIEWKNKKQRIKALSSINGTIGALNNKADKYTI